MRDFCEGRPSRFLVARDLRVIAPHPAHSPIAGMWNAYSPFTPMPPFDCRALEELAGLQLPPEDTASETE